MKPIEIEEDPISEKQKIIDEALMKNLKGGCGPMGCRTTILVDTCYEPRCNTCEQGPLFIDMCYEPFVVDC